MYEHNPQITLEVVDKVDIFIPPKGADRNVDVELVLNNKRVKDAITNTPLYEGHIIKDEEIHLVSNPLGLPNASGEFSTIIGNLGDKLYSITEDLHAQGVNHIGDGGRDVYDNGNYVYINGTNQAYQDVYEVLDQKLMVANINFSRLPLANNVTEFKIGGGNGADDHGGVTGDTNVEVTINGHNLYANYKIVHNGAGNDPTINHLVLTTQPLESHSFPTNTDNDLDIYTMGDKQGALALTYWGTNAGDVYLGYDNLQDMLNAMFNNVSFI